MAAPQVDFAGKTWVMSEEETGMLVQTGPVVVLSRREVEAVLAQMKRRVEAGYPDAEKRYGEKIKAYESLLRQGQGTKKEK